MRRRLITALVAWLLLPAGLALASWRPRASASARLTSASLASTPLALRCTSTLQTSSPVMLAWNAPLAGRTISYKVERRAGTGAWTTLSTTTATTLNDDPSALLALGTIWQYRVTASLKGWTSPVSSVVSATYTKVLVTVLSTCG